LQVDGLRSGTPLVCSACGMTCLAATPPWERWRRPVARVLTRNDLRCSLHHLMFWAPRPRVASESLDVRARRTFEFYCGACGHLQQARVWDIATEQTCSICGTVMIVPAPVRMTVDDSERHEGAALYCPRCGQRIEPADRTRRTPTVCPACRLRF